MGLDLSNPFEATVSEAILAVETNDGRFESFCRDVVSLIEGGAPILPTSKSWDLGRDGVGAGTANGIYVCASLRDDVDLKALQDLGRLKSTTRQIGRVYFCSSLKLSEKRISTIEGQLAQEVENAFPISCLGAVQLVDAARSDATVFARHYGAEIQSVQRAISSDPSDEAENHGLRLALMAAAG